MSIATTLAVQNTRHISATAPNEPTMPFRMIANIAVFAHTLCTQTVCLVLSILRWAGILSQPTIALEQEQLQPCAQRLFDLLCISPLWHKASLTSCIETADSINLNSTQESIHSGLSSQILSLCKNKHNLNKKGLQEINDNMEIYCRANNSYKQKTATMLDLLSSIDKLRNSITKTEDNKSILQDIGILTSTCHLALQCQKIEQHIASINEKTELINYQTQTLESLTINTRTASMSKACFDGAKTILIQKHLLCSTKDLLEHDITISISQIQLATTNLVLHSEVVANNQSTQSTLDLYRNTNIDIKQTIAKHQLQNDKKRQETKLLDHFHRLYKLKTENPLLYDWEALSKDIRKDPANIKQRKELVKQHHLIMSNLFKSITNYPLHKSTASNDPKIMKATANITKILQPIMTQIGQDLLDMIEQEYPDHLANAHSWNSNVIFSQADWDNIDAYNLSYY